MDYQLKRSDGLWYYVDKDGRFVSALGKHKDLNVLNSGLAILMQSVAEPVQTLNRLSGKKK